MGKKIKQKKVADAKQVDFYQIKNSFGNIKKIVFPNTVQVGLSDETFTQGASISGSIHLTHQGRPYLVGGTNVSINSSSNGQVTISAGANTGPQGNPGENAKTVNLTASSTIIQYDAAGSNPSPASITLTATSQEFTNGFFKFTGGGGAFSDEGSFTDGTAANSDTATFTVPGTFSSTPYDFRVGVSEGDQSEVVFDTLSIGSTRIGTTGDPGNDAVSKTVKLTASHTIIQYDAAGSNPSPSSITLTATSKNFTNGFFKFTGDSFSDEGSFTDGTGANSDTATFTAPSSFGSTPYTLRVGVAEADQSEVDFDTISIGSTRIGTTGTPGTDGLPTPDVSFTRSIISVDTDDTGGALDDGGDLSSSDISSQAFTKIDVNVGATNVTFAGHNESGNPSNNTYKIVTDNMTATTNNGTSLTEANAASENDGVSGNYDVTFANSGTRLTVNISSDSNDAKLKVTSLAEHEDGSNTDFNSIVVDVPVKVTTTVGTQTFTRSFTVQKVKQGSTGPAGSPGTGSEAVYLIEKEGDSNIVLDNAGGLNVFRGSRWGIKQDAAGNQTSVGASTENTDVVSAFTNGSSATDEAIFTLAATANYRVSVIYTNVRNTNGSTKMQDLELAVQKSTGGGYSTVGNPITYSIANSTTIQPGLQEFYFSAASGNTIKVGWRNVGGAGTNGNLKMMDDTGMARLVIEKL